MIIPIIKLDQLLAKRNLSKNLPIKSLQLKLVPVFIFVHFFSNVYKTLIR